MADAGEVLEMMRGVARTRIEMLNSGITFHNDVKKNFYRNEYNKKLEAIDKLIRRVSLRLIHAKDAPSSASCDDT